MPDMTDAINPQALKAARKRRGMSQQELADEIHAIAKGCTKDTVSRWERGTSSKIRSHLRKPLCHVLRVKWEKLTGPTDQPKDILDDATSARCRLERPRGPHYSSSPNATMSVRGTF